jgi:N-acyl homoserine lactone hydrolase
VFAGSRILVQQAEAKAARAPLYTVPEWAFPPGIELTLIEGDHDVASGVRIIATPGHTPGHQSVLVDDHDGTRTIVCCQATWSTSSFDAARLGDDGWDQAAGTVSLEKLHALQPDRVLVSHDADEWRRHASARDG